MNTNTKQYWNPLVPELTVSNIEHSVAFYKLCGFQVRFKRSNPNFYYLELGRAQIMLEEVCEDMWLTGDLVKPFGRGINFQIEVENIALLSESLKFDDIQLYRPIHKSQYVVNDAIESQLEMLVQDPDGYLLRFVQVCSE